MPQPRPTLVSEAENLRDRATFACDVLRRDIVRQAKRIQFGSWGTLVLGGSTSVAAGFQFLGVTPTAVTLVTSLVTTITAGIAKFIEQTQKSRIPKLVEGATKFGNLASSARQIAVEWEVATEKNKWDHDKAQKAFAPVRDLYDKFLPEYSQLGLDLTRPHAAPTSGKGGPTSGRGGLDAIGSGTGLNERNTGRSGTGLPGGTTPIPGGLPPQLVDGSWLGNPNPARDRPQQSGDRNELPGSPSRG